jgi:CheY-like chemotaxis protein
MAVASRVLIVEPDPAWASRVSAALSAEGLALTVVSGGVEALARAGQHDLVLAEVELPDIDGFELGRRLLAAGAAPALVYLTAQERESIGWSASSSVQTTS